MTTLIEVNDVSGPADLRRELVYKHGEGHVLWLEAEAAVNELTLEQFVVPQIAGAESGAMFTGTVTAEKIAEVYRQGRIHEEFARAFGPMEQL